MTSPERAAELIEKTQNLANISSANAGEPDGMRCLLSPGRSVCLSLRRVLSLQLDYDDIIGALDCLEDERSGHTELDFSGRKRFCAYHGEDGSYCLVCREYAVLRLSSSEAHCLREQLRNALETLGEETAP